MFPGGRSQHYHKMEEDYLFEDYRPVPCLPQSNHSYHHASHGYSGHGRDGYNVEFSERSMRRSNFSHHRTQFHSNADKFSSTMSQSVEMSMGHGQHGTSQMHTGGGYRPNRCEEPRKWNFWRGVDDGETPVFIVEPNALS